MTLRRAMESGLVLGGLWAFVEVVLTYATGFAPTGDVVEIFLAPLLLLLLYQATVLAVAQVRSHAVFDLLATAGVLLPPALFFWRGRGQAVPERLVAGLIPLVLCLLLAFRETKGPTSHRGWLTPLRMALIATFYFGAALAWAIRSDRVLAITLAMIATSAIWCAAGVAIAVIAAASTRRHAAAALCTVLVAASMVIAWQRGSGPPRFPEETVRTASAPPAKKDAPNVLLIVLDTVRADHLDLYGYSRPTFALTSKYLREGLVFDRAVSNGTFSLPSHASLFTGLLPSAHGARPVFGGDTAYGRLWPEIETLASSLRGRGYRTAGVSANDIFLADWTGLQKGFDTFSATAVRGVRFTPLSTMFRRIFARVTRSRRRAANNWTASQVTDAAIDLVSGRDEPFFLFLNYFDAHEPHAQIGSPPWFNAASARPADAYDTEIASIDSEVARLLKTLEQEGRLEHTLVVVAADHGEYFGERKLRGHPAAVYEGSTHIPLALRLPGVVPQGRTERRTGLHEVFRMVQDVIGKAPLDWLQAPDTTPRILTEAWARQDYQETMPADGRPSTTVVFAGNLKLIHRLSGKNELFDLEKDPAEAMDLIDSKEPALVALKTRMLREVDLRQVRAPGPAQPLTEDAKERLRALGYLK